MAVDDAGPNGLLLRGVEQEKALGVVVFPGGAGEVFPIDDARCGPGGETCGAALAMEAGLDGPGGSIAGCNDKSASAQPCIKTGFVSAGPRLNVHNCVIRLMNRGAKRAAAVGNAAVVN